MEAGRRTINDIFNGNRVLEIPFYQRSYVWKSEQWERMLTDMEYVSNTNKPYFMGSVILKQRNTSTDNSVGDLRIIIDGQQRLTTLNIFFKVLCLKNNMNNQFDRIFRLMNNELAVLHNHNDIQYFNEVMNLTELIDIESHNSIIGAYNFFRENINTEKIVFNNILTNIMFVGIDLGSEEDEQQIFDTINSLGVRLTTAELLKNYLFSRDDVNLYETKWKAIFEKDEEIKQFWDAEITAGRQRRENIDLFFYSFLQIMIQDKELKVSSEDKITYGKVENLFLSYKSFIEKYKIDKESLINDINKYASLYMKLIKFDVINEELQADYGIDRLNAIIFGLETTTIIPYVLYILKNQSSIAEQVNIFEYLESYIMRRMICHANTKNYNQLFSERLILNKVDTASKLKNYISNQADKINFMPNNDELKKGFKLSKLVNKQSAGILYMIESKIRNRNIQSTSLLGLNKYSLEHIMPKKWENNWNDLTSEEEKVERNRIILTLGNLTIITASLNASIRDSDWNTKKNGRGNKHGLKYYSSGIETLVEYLDLDVWNEEKITKRAEYLFDHAKEIWK